MVILAISDGATIAMWAANLAATGVLAIYLGRVDRTARRVERGEDARNAELAKISDRLHETTTKLVDERLRFVSHDIANHANALKLTMDDLKHRIETGDAEFSALGDRDQKIELSMAAKIDTLKDYIRENSASKDDVKEHEKSVASHLNRTDEKIAALSERVAVIADKVGVKR